MAYMTTGKQLRTQNDRYGGFEGWGVGGGLKSKSRGRNSEFFFFFIMRRTIADYLPNYLGSSHVIFILAYCLCCREFGMNENKYPLNAGRLKCTYTIGSNATASYIPIKSISYICSKCKCR